MPAGEKSKDTGTAAEAGPSPSSQDGPWSPRHALAFLGGHYHRIARRRGKTKAQVAVDRSILVIVCHLLSDPAARYTDLSYGLRLFSDD